jgi:hypothetical protein
MTLHLDTDTVDIRAMRLKGVPVHSLASGHPVIDVSEFREMDRHSYPTVFHVQMKSGTATETTVTKFRRHKPPPLDPDLYRGGPCMVEHNDWEKHHATHKDLEEDSDGFEFRHSNLGAGLEALRTQNRGLGRWRGFLSEFRRFFI